MGIMDQIWILLSAGAVWVMVREVEKADAKAYAYRRIWENREEMRERLARAARQNACSTEMPQLSSGKEQ